MFAGPIFAREALTLPRQPRHYVVRACYVALFCVLIYTAGQAAFGFQEVRSIGGLARFGNLLFQLFCFVQLTLVMFFALIFTAGSIAQEKDRRTLILLLMTDLKSRELVLGKMFASLLSVGVLIASSLPILFLTRLFGGVSTGQVWAAFGLCLATAIAAGAWGALVAFWREKTFQTLAITVLGAIGFLGVVELLAAVTGPAGSTIGLLDPYRALLSVLNPLSGGGTLSTAIGNAVGCVVALLLLSTAIIAYTSNRLRIWNPPRMVYQAANPEDRQTVRSRVRDVWENPIIWREIRTRAYGNKVILIKLAYVAVAVLLGFLVFSGDPSGGEGTLGRIGVDGAAFLGLTLLGLMLINTQAVTAMTTERDGQTLELLLVTDITAKEFIYGKLGGALWNSKELILVPLAFIGLMFSNGRLDVETCIYLTLCVLVLIGFAAMLGLHSGLSYESSRAAIANSLGTMFFLFIGIFIFMLLLIEARSSFMLQLPSFLIFIGMGSIGLFVSISNKNPSRALALAAALLPFLTFYGITSFLLGETLSVTLAIAIGYGFTVVAMLVPAISEFDVALGRTTLDG